jgi:hypothetical protein
MNHKQNIGIVALFGSALLGFSVFGWGAAQQPQTPFVDYTDKLPTNWQKLSGSRYDFKLSQDYPQTVPTGDAQPWKQVDFMTDPDGYALAVRDYAFDGFVHRGEMDKDFRPEFNDTRNWYHMPWMHVGPRGREGIRGLTREKDAIPQRFTPTQTDPAQDWGIGMFNAPGGYQIGQIWRDHNNPKPGGTFPEGTVIIKMLLTSAPVKEVPFLATSPRWTANINSALDMTSPRQIGSLRLIQMDIAVRDDRAPTTGWVFGTLVFDPTAKVDAATRAKFGRYSQMMPVGVVWGNDPGVLPGNTLKETKIAQRIPDYAKATLGFGGRLNGPGDNPVSACFSCHSTAQWPAKTPMAPSSSATPEQALAWYRNLPLGQAFDQGSQTFDMSLQAQIAMTNFTASK